MGGIGYITAFHAEMAPNSSMINVHMLESARLN
jgi:GDP-D-mannose 3', 5'-epimerase